MRSNLLEFTTTLHQKSINGNIYDEEMLFMYRNKIKLKKLFLYDGKDEDKAIIGIIYDIIEVKNKVFVCVKMLHDNYEFVFDEKCKVSHRAIIQDRVDSKFVDVVFLDYLFVAS